MTADPVLPFTSRQLYNSEVIDVDSFACQAVVIKSESDGAYVFQGRRM